MFVASCCLQVRWSCRGRERVCFVCAEPVYQDPDLCWAAMRLAWILSCIRVSRLRLHTGCRSVLFGHQLHKRHRSRRSAPVLRLSASMQASAFSNSLRSHGFCVRAVELFRPLSAACFVPTEVPPCRSLAGRFNRWSDGGNPSPDFANGNENWSVCFLSVCQSASALHPLCRAVAVRLSG